MIRTNKVNRGKEMDKPKFKLIKGNKGKSLRPEGMTFISSYATNTRLMGAMAMYIHWKIEREDFFQIFHFDDEEYGFDNYKGIKNEEKEQFILEKGALMGGLGGSYKKLNENEALYLVSKYMRYNKERSIPLPQDSLEFEFLYDEKLLTFYEEDEKLLDQLQYKICEVITMPNQLINYFMMRAVACDHEGILYLTRKNPIVLYEGIPGTLLKNEITPSHEKESTYLCETLVEKNDQYMIYISEIQIDSQEGLYVKDAKKLSTMNVSSIEASFMLNREENIDIYNVVNKEKLIRKLKQKKPHAMHNIYDAGHMVTEFNKDNSHVRDSIYKLNGDVNCIYYITEQNQMIVMSYDIEKLKRAERLFSSDEFKNHVQLLDKIDFQQSILYEFVYSQYEDFYEFLEELIR